MKRDLLIAASLVGIAMVAVGAVAAWYALRGDIDAVPLVKPRTEAIARSPRKDLPRPTVEAIRTAVKTPSAEKKPTPKKIEPQVDPDLIRVEHKVEAKIEARKQTVKVIAFDPLYRLNDPDGEYTVKALIAGKEIELIGTIKTLKIAGLKERSAIDASKLVAEEVIFTGDLGSGSRVTLGKARRVEFAGVIYGPDTHIDITLSKGGALKFRHIDGGATLLYRKAEPSEPAPRLDIGTLDARGVFREVAAGK